MTLAEARTALAPYDLDVTDVQALRAGSVNSNFMVQTQSGERYFVRLYEEQGLAGATAELSVIRELAANGVPTPAPLPRRGGGYVGEHRGKPLGVHPWVDGEILWHGRVDVGAGRAVGVALGRLHQCGERFSALGSERGILMPPLDDALIRYLQTATSLAESGAAQGAHYGSR